MRCAATKRLPGGLRIGEARQIHREFVVGLRRRGHPVPERGRLIHVQAGRGEVQVVPPAGPHPVIHRRSNQRMPERQPPWGVLLGRLQEIAGDRLVESR